MNGNRLKQIINEVNKEQPDALNFMDPTVRDYVRNIAIQNKQMKNEINILKANMHTLLTWHHYEFKKSRLDSDGKRYYLERFMYLSKTDVEIMKLPRPVK